MSVIFQFSQSSSAQISYSMNKSLHRNKRHFANDIKNSLTQNHPLSKPLHKTKYTKIPQPTFLPSSSSRPQMQYFDEILQYAFTSLSYPQFLKGPQKVKRDVQMLLKQITVIDSSDCIWHQNFIPQTNKENQYFCGQEITLEKRTSLVDWIITVHKKYKLRQQTLHMTVKLIDDYCNKNKIPLSKYQLLGISALFMSAKYQEIQLPRFKDYYRLVQGQFQKQQIITMENQILMKAQFSLCKKINVLWYLQAFGQGDFIFGTTYMNKIFKKSKKQQSNKENIMNSIFPNIQEQVEENRCQKYISYCHYILNLILLDYKIIAKFKQDIIAIATLIFVSFKRDFADADGKGLLKHFVEKKQRLQNERQSAQKINRTVKKCMNKIQKLHSQRFSNKFYSINEKFNIDLRQ